MNKDLFDKELDNVEEEDFDTGLDLGEIDDSTEDKDGEEDGELVDFGEESDGEDAGNETGFGLSPDEITSMTEEEFEEYTKRLEAEEDEEFVDFGEDENESVGEIDDALLEDGDSVNEFGTEVNIEDEGLLEDDEQSDETIETVSTDFINDNGEIVVMDSTGDGDYFEYKKIPLEQITVVKRIRQSKGVDELLQSIRSTGIIKPIVVALTMTDGVYVLIDGYRRVLACAKAGIKQVPAIINKRVTTTEIPVLEAMYNHTKSYNMREIIDYIDYLEKEKGIMSATMIEYLLQLDSGDYSKLKDILEDDDEDIVGKLLEGQFTISAAFKALEKRRAKESKEEKEMKKTAKVYADAEESGVAEIKNSGETGDEGVALTDEEIAELNVNINDVLEDKSDEGKTLEEMVSEGKSMEGFEPDKQNRKAGENIDEAVRKAVLTRDSATCKCCGFGGAGFEKVMDIHHITGVAQGQNDDVDGLITLCITCHMLVELWGYGKLPIADIDSMDEKEKERMKKVIKIGNIKREALIKVGKKREQIKEEAKTATQLRRMPGAPQPRL